MTVKKTRKKKAKGSVYGKILKGWGFTRFEGFGRWERRITQDGGYFTVTVEDTALANLPKNSTEALVMGLIVMAYASGRQASGAEATRAVADRLRATIENARKVLNG